MPRRTCALKAQGSFETEALRGAKLRHGVAALNEREFIEYKTSMITDYDPLRGLLWSEGVLRRTP